MKVALIVLLGIFLPLSHGLGTHPSPANEAGIISNNKPNLDIGAISIEAKNITVTSNRDVNILEKNTNNVKNEDSRQDRHINPEEAIVINLEEINNMTFFEFVKRRVRSIWNRVDSKKFAQEDGFVGRCLGMARKIKMMMPFLMIGLGVIGTKLAFLTLFSLKSLALLGLLVMMNIATGAAKLGALFASKKHDSKPQIMHFHVHPDAVDHHGPHGGYWEDRNDLLDMGKLERKDLYNLYDKLKAEEYRKQQFLYNS